jgi:predicted naringenin-chalcone synthase
VALKTEAFYFQGVTMTDQIYYVRQIASTMGKHHYSQEHLAEEMRARIRYSDLPNTESITQMVYYIYSRSGIKKRHIELELSQINSRKDWIKLVNEATLMLCERVLTNLFSSDVKASDCDGFIVVSSSYTGFPGITRQLQEKFGFPMEALCYDMSALGCAGIPHSLFLAHTLIKTGRCKQVCIMSADALGTHGESRQHNITPTMSQIVAHCLPSDSAAGIIISSKAGDKPIFSYRDCHLDTKLWSNSLDWNVMSATEDNQPYVNVGKEIRTRLLEEVEQFFTPEILEQPIFLHHGGDALMKVVSEKYPQLSDFMKLSTSEFQSNGNIGPSTVLWILHRALEREMPISPCFRLVAFGPGKVTAICLVDGVEMINNVIEKPLLEAVASSSGD